MDNIVSFALGKPDHSWQGDVSSHCYDENWFKLKETAKNTVYIYIHT